jgi:hypothetical protein
LAVGGRFRRRARALPIDAVRRQPPHSAFHKRWGKHQDEAGEDVAKTTAVLPQSPY